MKETKNSFIMMKQLKLILLLLIATAVQARAGSVKYLTVTVKGSPVVFALADHPVITYTGNTLHFQTPSGTVDVPVADITDIVFTETGGADIKGDLNGDGKVNALDIQEIINACVAERTEAKYDLNGDGKVNALDIQEVINIAADAK
jgi:hypothetical protein